MKILVTGSSGFIGTALCDVLKNKNFTVVPIVRKTPLNNQISIDDIGAETDWNDALKDVDSVIHLAGRVHVMKDKTTDPLLAFRKINVMGTLNLARQAASNGVKRFIFISSIKINGECTPLNCPFTAADIPRPIDPYGISKYEAEEGLFHIANKTNMEIVIIRPPLVYGPGVKANFLNMMKWLSKGIPLPFGKISNKRSLVALENLIDLIITCIEHPAAANQVFLVADGEDLSTTELLYRTANALNKHARLLPVNHHFLQSCLTLLGKNDLALRLCGSLQIDINKTEKLLNWVPPVSVDESLNKTAQHYIKTQL